jgi:hypothetical protein
MEIKARYGLKNEKCFTFIDYQIHIKKMGEIAVALV